MNLKFFFVGLIGGYMLVLYAGIIMYVYTYYMIISSIVQTSWGLALPLLGFGDQLLDFWFIINNWNSFKYIGLKYVTVIHLIIISIIQFAYGYWWIGKTNYPKNTWFRILWGILSWFNVLEIYLFFTNKLCCSCSYCGGKYKNPQFQLESKKMMEIQLAIHAFGEDMFQVTFQLVHLLSYYDPTQTNLSQNLGQGLDVLSIMFGFINLIFVVLYFLFLRFLECGCQCNLFWVCCLCLLPNKGIETENNTKGDMGSMQNMQMQAFPAVRTKI